MVAFLFGVWAVWTAEAREFYIQREFVRLRDGVRISTTILRPESLAPGEKFPVLLEMQPYRKDDLFLAQDYALHSYFARAGYVVIKADVRGTGSSEGRIPDREYSEEELEDARELIEHYARQPWSNGRVGMFGISWSGFNALQTALRRPEGLKAILAAHASDDLFYDDVHFLDGNFHVDPYELSIENDLSLPRSPDYKLDAEYFASRFNRKPWFFRYKREQRDGLFWRKESLRHRYDRLTVPTFLIGGLLDGYRDTLSRALESAAAPVKAVLGPWAHSWPDTGPPCPCYEWRSEALRWWDYWLKDQGERPETGKLAFFQRHSTPPFADLKEYAGEWRKSEWPPRAPETREIAFPSASAGWDLPYKPAVGFAAGFWWGDATPDMAAESANRLTFDTERRPGWPRRARDRRGSQCPAPQDRRLAPRALAFYDLDLSTRSPDARDALARPVPHDLADAPPPALVCSFRAPAHPSPLAPLRRPNRRVRPAGGPARDLSRAQRRTDTLAVRAPRLLRCERPLERHLESGS